MRGWQIDSSVRGGRTSPTNVFELTTVVKTTAELAPPPLPPIFFRIPSYSNQPYPNPILNLETPYAPVSVWKKTQVIGTKHRRGPTMAHPRQTAISNYTSQRTR